MPTTASPAVRAGTAAQKRRAAQVAPPPRAPAAPAVPAAPARQAADPAGVEADPADPAGVQEAAGRWRWLSGVAGLLTTPLSPRDYLAMVDPLRWSRELCGRVEQVRPETADAATLVIRPGAAWRARAGRWRAGQHVRVGVDVDGARCWRTYSLSSPPGRGDGRFTITVRAVAGGRVSPYLVHRLRPGTLVRLGVPQGSFVLPDRLPRRLLFVTAGSGITPVMGMLRELAARAGAGDGGGGRAGLGVDVVLVHCAPTADDVIFGGELRALAARSGWLRLHERHTRLAGRLDLARLDRLCPDWAGRQAWVCGPPGLLQAAQEQWRRAGVAGRLRVERFGPVLAGPAGAGGRVSFVRSGRRVDADGATPLLAVGEGAGVLMPGGCRMGVCRTCVSRLVSGRVRDLRTGRVFGEGGELVQTCVTAAAGDVEIDR